MRFRKASTYVGRTPLPNQGFLSTLHSRLNKGAAVYFRCQLADSDVASHRRDADGNMLAERVADGQRFLVVKNIPTEQDIRDALRGTAENIEYAQSSMNGWSVSCTVV